MNKTMITLALAASLISLPAAAQHAGHGSHAPAQPQEQATQGPGSMQHGKGPGAAGEGPRGAGMMNCPMMQGMMGGMMSGMMGGHAAGHGRAAEIGDQSVASLALNAVNEKMHREMAIAFTGNPDVDFVRGMIAHHQGAIDMAKVVRAFGDDPEIRELADAIIEAQEDEISMMRDWLARNESR